MSRAVQPSGRCGHGISHSGSLRGASLSTDWQAKSAQNVPAFRVDLSENCRIQEPSQDGAEAGCHCHPAHGRAVSQRVRTGIPCRGPSQACITWGSECIRLSAHEIVAGRRGGSVKCTKCLQVCGKKHLRVWLLTACIPWQAKDQLFISLPPGLPASHPAVEQL